MLNQNMHTQTLTNRPIKCRKSDVLYVNVRTCVRLSLFENKYAKSMKKKGKFKQIKRKPMSTFNLLEYGRSCCCWYILSKWVLIDVTMKIKRLSFRAISFAFGSPSIEINQFLLMEIPLIRMHRHFPLFLFCYK